MMSVGEVPAAIVAAPDGMYDGKNRIHSPIPSGLMVWEGDLRIMLSPRSYRS